MRKSHILMVVSVLILCLFASCNATPQQSGGGEIGYVPEVNYHYFDKGATVIKSADSPTGYLAVFVYAEEDSYEGLADVAKVELYSDCMMLFRYDEQKSGALDPSKAHEPYDYETDMYPAGGNGDTTFYVTMTEFEEGLWGAAVPLTSGAFVYNFRVTDSTGKQVSRLDDPSNPTLTNTATGIHSLSSMVYVPYSSAAMGTGDWKDRSVELPREDGQTGKVETIAYTGAAGDQRGLAVYLPYGYDANRAEPYKVLYLSHGASGDKFGNELRWVNEGAVANIMDNLIAEGKVEPFVVVTMNNQDLSFDFTKVWAEQELIMAEIESKYNVADTPEGRAFAGLSMGGYTTSNVYMQHTEDFSYFGIWSYANVAGLTDEVKDKLAAAEGKKVFCAAGEWDYLLSPVQQFSDALDEIGIEHEMLKVPGAHDWETWQLLYTYATENFFWK